MDVQTWKKLKKLSQAISGLRSSVIDGLVLMNQKMESIMATQAELKKEVEAIGQVVTKIGTEITTLKGMVKDLQDAAANASPELQAAVEAVAQQVKAVDDQIPDDVPPAA